MPRTTEGSAKQQSTVATEAGAPRDASTAPVKLHRPDVSLTDKYLLEQGTIFLSGTQALVRVLLDQVRADRRRGLKTATFVSGYQGSPLGGLDKEILRAGRDRDRPRAALRRRAQRGAGGDRGLRHRSWRRTRSRRPAAGRRRDRRLVRQEPRPGPRGRRAAPRELRRHPPARRCARAGRRRSVVQVLHLALGGRGDAGGAAHADVLPGHAAGGPGPRAARGRVLARVGAVERDEGRHQHRRQRGDRAGLAGARRRR